MAYNLGTLKTRVQQKLDNTSFEAAKITQFLNDAQRDIVGKLRATYMEAQDDVTTSDGSDELGSFPTDIQVPLSLRVYSPSGSATILPYVEYEDIDTMSPNVSAVNEGPPSAWYIFAGTIKVYPVADATYTLKLRYIKKPTELSSDSDVPAVPEEFSEPLVLGAYARCLEHDDDFDQASIIRGQMDSMLIDMNTRYRRQQGTPHVMRQPNVSRIIGRV